MESRALALASSMTPIRPQCSVRNPTLMDDALQQMLTDRLRATLRNDKDEQSDKSFNTLTHLSDGGASNSTTSNVKKDMNMFEHWSEGGASAGKAALVPNSVAEFVLCDTTHRTNNSPRWDGDGSDEKDKAQVQVVLSSIEKRKAGALRPMKALSWKQKSLGSNRWHLERISDVAVNVPPPCEPSTSLPPAKPPMSDGVTADHDRQEALEVDSPTVDKSLSSLSVYRLSASLSLLK